MPSSVSLELPRPTPVAPPPRPPLARDRECMVTGVSAGLARHLGVPVWMVRALFLVLTMFSGVGMLLYVWCWVFMPWQQGNETPSHKAPVAWMLTAAATFGMFVFSTGVGQYLYRDDYYGASATAV